MPRRKPLYGIGRDGVSAKKGYRLTPGRRQSILKAQRISARKRAIRPKDQVGYWIARGVKKVGNKATLGVAGHIATIQELNGIENRKHQRKKRRR